MFVLRGFGMAGGYRCTHGHSWNPADGAATTACPVCGDTVFIAVAFEEQAILATSNTPSVMQGGQDQTQSLPLPKVSVMSADHAPTVAFVPPLEVSNGFDSHDPSFSSLVKLIPESNGSAASNGSSSIVPFGTDDSAESGEFAPPLVPGYEILHEVGRGGMGVVYKARQVSLNRLVALKMILSGSHAGPNERERFKREAEAVAALQNPHIVQIFEIGEANGHPYLALEFVEGGSLAHNLSGEPWQAIRAAELIEILARTMQFAHDAGIVHRDLKPGNILLTSAERGMRNAEFKAEETEFSNLALRDLSSTFLPKVTDFGLAKRLDETQGVDYGTRTGAVMGTPSYIAPEQAGGKTRDIGASTDVYALGAILYELLTGRPPFRGETPLATVLQVLHDDPVTPKRLHPLVPRDLETICLKCLSKQPALRYANAAALADDLRRFIKGEPIKARPMSAWGRGVKWARRHPALAVLLFMTIAATVSLVAVLSVAYLRVRDVVAQREHEKELVQRERDRAELEKKRAEELAAENARRRAEAEREAEDRRRAAYALQLSQVAILCERDPLRAVTLLEDETRCPKDLRDFAWHYLRRLCQRDDRAYMDHQAHDPLRAVAYSPNATFIATAGDAGSIRLWDSRTGRTWLVLSGHVGAVHGLAFSPDSSILASVGADGTVRLWVLPIEVLITARKAMDAMPWMTPIVSSLVKAPVLAPIITLTDAHVGEVTCVAFSPDSRSLVSGGKDGFLRWWDLTAWRPSPVTIAGLSGLGATATLLRRAEQSPDARPVWAVREVLAHKGGEVLSVAFSQNGKLLASGGSDKYAKVWAGDGSKLVHNLPRHADAVRAVAVSPDGKTVATVNNGTTPTIRLFDTQTWRERRLFGHTKSIYALTFSDDGQLLGSAGFDKAVCLWNTDEGRERGHLVGHTQQVNALAFAPDRRTIVSAGMDGVAIVWQTNARTHEPADLLQLPDDPPLPKPAQGVISASIGGAGTTFLVADDIGRVRMFAADHVQPGQEEPAGPRGPLTLMSLPQRALPYIITSARATTVSPDGSRFAIAYDSVKYERGIAVWQPLPGFKHPRLQDRHMSMTYVKTPLAVHSISIDPSSRWLATADAGAVRLYDMRDIPIATQPTIKSHVVNLKGGFVVHETDNAREVIFHPTRDWLAVTVGNGVRIVTREGNVLSDMANAHGAQAVVDAVAFDKFGNLLATGDASGLIKLWSLDESGKLTFLRDLKGHTSPVFTLAFSPDGRTLASGGDDREVILWDPVAGRERLALTGHADRVIDLSFTADGTALVTVSRDGAVKRWRADVRPTAEPVPLWSGAAKKNFLAASGYHFSGE